jgi:hypothetical protein
MHQFRITKYNPKKRDAHGAYTLLDEWTSYSDVGKSVSRDEYLKVEKAYIETAIDFMIAARVEALTIAGLEDNETISTAHEGERILVADLEAVLRSLLREEFWCKLESDDAYMHFGWDYYMYIGVKVIDEKTIQEAHTRGLYVEACVSPHR